MFEFEYDNFLDEYNGLKIVIRNTAGGQLVCYSIDNDGVRHYHIRESEKIFGATFYQDVMTALSWIFLFSIRDERYSMIKKLEAKEIIKKQIKQFLLDYFQVEDMRDLLVRDDFFDKPMFIEP